MKNIKQLILIFGIFISTSILSQEIEPTIAKRVDSVRILHGDTTHDYYYWMQNKKNNEFINHLYAENAYADRIMRKSWLLQKRLYEEEKSYVRKTFKSDSTLKEGYWYYSRLEENKDYAIYCRKKDTINAKEEIYFDGNKLAERYSYFSLSTFSFSPNMHLLAYAINNDGSDKGYLFIKDVDNDTLLKDEVERVADFIWVNDTVFLYTQEDKKTKRSNRLYRHTLGSDVKNDTLIWWEQDKSRFINLSKTSSKEYIQIIRGGMDCQEIYYAETKNPYSKFRLFQETVPHKTYNFNHYKNDSSFYIYTNIGNINGKVMQCPINKTGKENWTDLINLPDSLELKSYFLHRKHIIYSVNYNGLNHIIIRDRETNKEKQISIEGENYILDLNNGFGYDSLKFRYGFTSMIQPYITHEYDLITGKDTIVKTEETVLPYNKDDYETKRLWATAKDGTKIPIDIVYKKGIKLDGNNPTLMYAYSCYGSNSNPYFSETRQMYLNRGFIYAIAHVRGSSFLGQKWHKDGYMMKKINTYTDFISCAEFLIDSGYTSSKKLAANGGSAGGMLMGAVVTMRPDLFKCVVPDVPFVDVLYEMQDTAWNNIVPHFYEIGNPFIKEQYDYIKTWCPYQNIKDTVYPDILVTSGFNDSRVPVWSPAKWVAKLRYHKTDTNLLLFKVNMGAGHGGASGRYKYLGESSFKQAFIMQSLGIKENYVTVHGKVYDANGEILPFVNVYVKGTTQGTTSNYEGEFSVDLQEGNSQTLVFQYVGFNKKEVLVDMKTQTSDLKITLETAVELLPQAVVSASGRDPAYAIIESAQKVRKKHLKQVDAYSVDIYIKGVSRLNETPEKLPAFMKNWDMPDSTDLGLLSLSESVAKYFYQAPDDYKEQMIASKVAGTNQGYSWNRAGDVMLNFYQNNIPMGWFAERGFISPIATSAMLYYKYQLTDVKMDNGKTIYKIKVIPRRKHDPVFKGYVYIVDSTWNFYTVDLTLTKDANIKMIDSIQITQTHIPVNDSIWMPFTIQFVQHFKVFGFGGTDNSIGTFSNYNLSPNFDKKFFGNEIFRIEDEANKKDTVYWDKSRYIVLTDEEKEYYSKEDSILQRRKDPEYLDSLKKAGNKFRWNSVWLKKFEYKNYPKYRSFRIGPIISPKALYFNTVEGFTARLSANWYFFDKEKEKEENRLYRWDSKVSINPEVKYSFTNNQLYGTVFIRTDFLYLHAGRDFINYANMRPLVNSVYTLLAKENYGKFYKKDFLRVWKYKRIMRGLVGKIDLQYERRYPQQNNSDFSLYNYMGLPDKDFISNNPLNPDDDALSFKQHDVFIADFNFTIKFKQKYSTYPKWGKVYHDSKYPTVYLKYKTAFYTSDSRTGFNFASLAVSDIIDMKMFGKSIYTVNAGGFFASDKNMEFIDYQHFMGNQTIFLMSSWGVQAIVPFNTLNYFDYSTNKYYLSGRWEHHFNGWVFNKLPVFRKLKFQVLAGTAMLYSENNGLFTELFIGAENIFNVLRVDFVTNYQNEKINPLIRVGIDVPF